jgi:hypothetical protein
MNKIYNYNRDAIPFTTGIYADHSLASLKNLNQVIDYLNQIAGSTDPYGLKLIKRKCGEVIPAHRAVVIINDSLYLFDNTNLSHYNRCVGFSNQAGNINDLIDVVISGEVTTGFPVINGAIYYAGLAGSLVTTPPSTGIMQSIAIATTTNKLLLKLTQPIIKI